MSEGVNLLRQALMGRERITFSDLACVVRSAFHPIRLIRLYKKYSLRHLSAETGLSWMTIHLIETLHNNPQPLTVYKIAQVLGVNPAELYVKCLEYGMEKVATGSKKTLRVVAKDGETSKQMLARLVHRQLHPFYRNLNKLDKSAADYLIEINVCRATLKNWLDMKTTPSTKTLKKIADGFGLTLDDLLFSIEEWNSEDLSDPVRYIENNIHRLED
tara:strand:- start:19143 stop:19790 length:648 start_codon:yes stop_codon:yes gene_type:complete